MTTLMKVNIIVVIYLDDDTNHIDGDDVSAITSASTPFGTPPKDRTDQSPLSKVSLIYNLRILQPNITSSSQIVDIYLQEYDFSFFFKHFKIFFKKIQFTYSSSALKKRLRLAEPHSNLF